jgi:hypothetical protein
MKNNTELWMMDCEPWTWRIFFTLVYPTPIKNTSIFNYVILFKNKPTVLDEDSVFLSELQKELNI